MPDIRSLIFARLAEILANVPEVPVVKVYRNRGEFTTALRPCIVLLEGSEDVVQNFEGHKGRVYARTSSSVMRLRPELWRLLRKLKPEDTDEYALEFEASRNGIVKAILSDNDLANLTGPNGDVAYRGYVTDMQSGSTMEGSIRLDFAFYYVLNPATDL